MELITNLSLLLLCASALAQTAPFDSREATVESVHHALFTGLNTCRDVVSSFLARIAALNDQINAIITLDPQVLDTADYLDTQLSVGNASGSLFCIPILLKDNYDTASVPTTGGCLGLKDSQPKQDAPSVAALKNAGAVVLGKTNLHELALEGLSVSSYGGQTINPYDNTRTPGGSSGGSGAAVAASFSVFATGTDTVNSLRSPASANSLFSIRPTRGLISRNGVIPISHTQDALGAIARSVKDVALALTVMASIGFDPADNVTALNPASGMRIDYAACLRSATMKGLRLGLVTTFFNRTPSVENDPVNAVMDATMSRLQAAGATIISLNDSIYNSSAILAKYDTQRFEYREEMTSYLSTSSLGGTHPSSLQQLYATNASSEGGQFLVIPSQYEYVTTSLVSATSNSTYASVQSGIRNLTLAMQETFKQNNLDALIYPEQQNLVVEIGSPSQSGRNGILAAVSGSPIVTVPAGFSKSTSTAPLGVPIGMEILGLPWNEQKLLNIARAFEQLGRIRQTPVWADRIIEVGNLRSVPIIKPNNGNVSPSYPLGKL